MVNLDWEPAAFGRFDFILDAGRHCVIARKARPKRDRGGLLQSDYT